MTLQWVLLVILLRVEIVIDKGGQIVIHNL
jgi:hypothetical protein